MKNGWRKICGIQMYVEDGKIVRGEINGQTVFPYRWDKNYGAWSSAGKITVDAFRSGWYRGAIAVR